MATTDIIIRHSAKSNTNSCAFAGSVTAGDLLVVVHEHDGAQSETLGPTDTIGTVYTLVNRVVTPGPQRIEWWVGYAPSSGANTVNTNAVGTFCATQAICLFSTYGRVALVDQDTDFFDVTAGVDNIISPVAGTLFDGGMALSIVGTDSATFTLTPTPFSGTTIQSQVLGGGPNDYLVTAWKAVDKTDSPIDFHWSTIDDGSGQVFIGIFNIIPDGTALGSDIFVRSDQDLNSGGWITAGFAAGPMQILSSSVWGNLNPSGSIVTGVTFPGDQWAQTIWGGGGSDSGDNVGIGLLLRASGTSAYTCIINSTGDVWVGKYVSGTYTPIGNFQTMFNVGDRVRFEAIGTRLYVVRNGVQLGTWFNDSSLSSGSPGIIRKDSSSNKVDEFYAGDFLGPTVISVQRVDASAGSGSGFANVPTGTEAVLAFWAHYNVAAQSGIGMIAINSVEFSILDEIQTKQTASDQTGTGVALLMSPTIGISAVDWDWTDTDARDEGGAIFLVYLKDVMLSDLFRDVATSSTIGGNIPTVVMTTVTTDKCIALYQEFSTGGVSGNDFPKAWADNSLYNSEHYYLVESGYDFINDEDGVWDPISGDYSTIAAIVLKREYDIVIPPAGDAGPTLIRVQGNRAIW